VARRLARMARKARARRGGAGGARAGVDYNAEMIAPGESAGGEPEIAWSVRATPSGCRCATARGRLCDRLRDPQRHRHLSGAARARRVLRPGGRFLCLEFSRPTGAALQKAYDAYSFNVIPRSAGRSRATARAPSTSSRASAPSRTSAPSPPDRGRGFGRVGWTNYTGGGGGAAHRLGVVGARRLIAAAVGARARRRPAPRELDAAARRRGGRARCSPVAAEAARRPGERLARTWSGWGPWRSSWAVLSTRPTFREGFRRRPRPEGPAAAFPRGRRRRGAGVLNAPFERVPELRAGRGRALAQAHPRAWSTAAAWR
jgi:hypothetical protein